MFDRSKDALWNMTIDDKYDVRIVEYDVDSMPPSQMMTVFKKNRDKCLVYRKLYYDYDAFSKPNGDLDGDLLNKACDLIDEWEEYNK